MEQSESDEAAAVIGECEQFASDAEWRDRLEQRDFHPLETDPTTATHPAHGLCSSRAVLPGGAE